MGSKDAQILHIEGSHPSVSPKPTLAPAAASSASSTSSTAIENRKLQNKLQLLYKEKSLMLAEIQTLKNLIEHGSPMRQQQMSSTDKQVASLTSTSNNNNEGKNNTSNGEEIALNTGWNKLVDANIRSGLIACMWCLKAHVLRRTAQAFHKWRVNSALMSFASTSSFVLQPSTPINSSLDVSTQKFIRDEKESIMLTDHKTDNVSHPTLTRESIRSMTITDAELDRRREWLLNYASNLVLGIRNGASTRSISPSDGTNLPNPPMQMRRLGQPLPLTLPPPPTFSSSSSSSSLSNNLLSPSGTASLKALRSNKSQVHEPTFAFSPEYRAKSSPTFTSEIAPAGRLKHSFMAPTHSSRRKSSSSPPPLSLRNRSSHTQPTQRVTRYAHNPNPNHNHNSNPNMNPNRNPSNRINQQNDYTFTVDSESYWRTDNVPSSMRASPPLPPPPRQHVASYLQPTHSSLKKTMGDGGIKGLFGDHGQVSKSKNQTQRKHTAKQSSSLPPTTDDFTSSRVSHKGPKQYRIEQIGPRENVSGMTSWLDNDNVHDEIDYMYLSDLSADLKE